MWFSARLSHLWYNCADSKPHNTHCTTLKGSKLVYIHLQQDLNLHMSQNNKWMIITSLKMIEYMNKKNKKHYILHHARMWDQQESALGYYFFVVFVFNLYLWCWSIMIIGPTNARQMKTIWSTHTWKPSLTCPSNWPTRSWKSLVPWWRWTSGGMKDIQVRHSFLCSFISHSHRLNTETHLQCRSHICYFLDYWPCLCSGQQVLLKRFIIEQWSN